MKKGILFVMAAVMVGMMFVSCAKATPLTEAHKSYAGKWVTDDGTYVQIYLNGKASLKTANTSVSGGNVVFAEGDKSFKIELMGIGTTYQIGEAPHPNADGKMQMRLNGNVYTKE